MKVKVCSRPWEYAQVYNEKGDVRTCPWATRNYIGNLVESDFSDIFHSRQMRRFRKSILDGSYKYCLRERCPYLSNNTLDQHLIEIDSDYEPDYPVVLSLSYDKTCNYVCTSCRQGRCIYSDSDRENIRIIEFKLSCMLNNVKSISANGCGEIFASPSILRLLQGWLPEYPSDEVTVEIETNGSLFDEVHWEKISNLGKYNLKVFITIMSFDEKAYQYLSGTCLSITKLLNNLTFVRKLRDAGVITELELATVVQERNFRWLPEFTKCCIEEFNADRVRLRPYFPYGARDRVFEWFCDIRNPYHPYHDEYQMIMSDPIFNNPKVFKWSGDLLSEIGPCESYVSLYKRVLLRVKLRLSFLKKLF